MNNTIKSKDFFLKILLYVFVPMTLMLSYEAIKSGYEDKLWREQGTDTESVVVAYREGKMGVRGVKKGYYNACQYFIGDSIRNCYIFTTTKPLPLNEKIKVKYFQFKDGRIRIGFPNEVKEKYREYGFNDYGY